MHSGSHARLVTSIQGGRRRFDADALGLLEVLLRLRRTGMPVEQVREFIAADLDQLQADLEVIDVDRTYLS